MTGQRPGLGYTILSGLKNLLVIKSTSYQPYLPSILLFINSIGYQIHRSSMAKKNPLSGTSRKGDS